MRRALVAVLALLGLAALLVGIGLRTVWMPEDRVTATAQLPEPGLVVVTAPGLLEARPGPVTVTARTEGGGPVLLAVGRERDVEAYVAGLPGFTLTGFEPDAPARLTSSALEPAPAEPTPAEPTPAEPTPAEPAPAEPAPAEQGQPALADPATSDLWVQRVTGTGSAELTYAPPEGRWLLLASGDGTSPAPDTLTLSWPQEVRTPWSTPLIVLGTVLLVGALALAVLNWRPGRQQPPSAGDRPDSGPVLAEERTT